MRRRYSLGGMTEAKQRLASDLENLSPKQRTIYQRNLNTIMTDSRFDILTEEDLADYVNGWYGEDVVTTMDFTGPKAFNFGFKVLALWESQKIPEFWEEKLYMEKGGRVKMIKVKKELIKYGHSPKTAIKMIDEYKDKVNFDSEPQQIAWEIDKMSSLKEMDEYFSKRKRFKENLD